MATADTIVTAAIAFEDALVESRMLLKSFDDLAHYVSDKGGDFVESPPWLYVISRQFDKLSDASRAYLDVVHERAMPIVRDMDRIAKK
jgi:hypothetical protein